MHYVYKSLTEALRTLCDPKVLRGVKDFLKNFNDTKIARSVLFVLSSSRWNLEFRFVDLFSAFWTSIESWGDSCWCHQEDFFNHVSIECVHRGRLLSHAFQFAVAKFDAFLTTVDAWVAEDWDGDFAFLM